MKDSPRSSERKVNFDGHCCRRSTLVLKCIVMLCNLFSCWIKWNCSLFLGDVKPPFLRRRTYKGGYIFFFLTFFFKKKILRWMLILLLLYCVYWNLKRLEKNNLCYAGCLCWSAKLEGGQIEGRGRFGCLSVIEMHEKFSGLAVLSSCCKRLLIIYVTLSHKN